MIDIKFLRENPDIVKENIKKKFQDHKLVLVDEVIDLDKKNREVKLKGDELRSIRNSLSSQIGNLMRNGEKDEIIDAVRKFFDDDHIEYIKAPGTLEGGDVMMCGDHFYVGRSARTNEEGIRQLTEILAKYGMTCSEVKLEEVLHLKTGVNYLEDNNMLVSGEFVDKEDFASYNKVVIPEEEAYAANCIWVNDTVIVPEGYPAVLKAVQDLGYKTLTVDTSEYRKLDGGLSCLSLRF